MRCCRCNSKEKVNYLEDFENYFCENCKDHIFEDEISEGYSLNFETESPYLPGDYPIPKHILDQLPEPSDSLFNIQEFKIKRVGVDFGEYAWYDLI